MIEAPIIEKLSRSLAELENIIQVGQMYYVQVGEALREIQEGKLYREAGYKTFEEYCEHQWGFSRQAAYNYIGSAEVAENVYTYTQNQPSVSQAQLMRSLTPKEQQQVASSVDFENTSIRDLKEHIANITGCPHSVHFSSESEEWYTPNHILRRVVDVLGAIDLDPCSNFSKSVPATRHFTKADDGLSKTWEGRVYMNPPYGDAISSWVQKLITEYGSGNVTEALALIPARVDTAWFKKFSECAVLFVWGRLKFSESENSAPFPSAIVYLGNARHKFKEVFADLGKTWVELE